MTLHAAEGMSPCLSCSMHAVLATAACLVLTELLVCWRLLNPLHTFQVYFWVLCATNFIIKHCLHVVLTTRAGMLMGGCCCFPGCLFCVSFFCASGLVLWSLH